MSQEDTPDRLTDAQRAEIREIVRDEIGSDSAPITRRDALKAGGLAAALGLTGGAVSGSAAAATGGGDAQLSIGSVTANTYRVAGNLYSGSESATSELAGELSSDDAGAKYRADDTGAWYHFDGSSFVLMDGKVGSFSADHTHTNSIPPDYVVYKSAGTIYADAQRSSLASESGTDFATVVNAAIGNLPGRTNEAKGKIYIKEGYYSVSSTIKLLGQTFLQGSGILTTELELADGVDDDVIQVGPSTSDGDVGFTKIRDMKIAGNKANNTAGRGIYQDVSGSNDNRDLKIQNVFVSSTEGVCMDIQNSWGLRLINSWTEFSNSHGLKIDGLFGYVDSLFTAHNSGDGIHNPGSPDTLRNAEINAEAYKNGGYAVNIPAGSHNEIHVTALDNGQGAHLNVHRSIIDVTSRGATVSSGYDITCYGDGCVARLVSYSAADDGIDFGGTGSVGVITSLSAGTHAVNISGGDFMAMVTAINAAFNGVQIAANDTLLYIRAKGNGDNGVLHQVGNRNIVWARATGNATDVKGLSSQANLHNGYGLNSGDPNSTGNWNGNGFEGAVVYDTSVARPYTEYQYVDGAWQTA